jgi:class 3 adenylate cyclase
MNTFTEYQNIIEKALNRNTFSKAMNLNESFNNATGLNGPAMATRMSNYFSYNDYLDVRSKLSLSHDLVQIAKKMGAVPIPNQVVGHHPDFSYLKGTGRTEKHYIVSAFIDIKGSTNLFKKYDEETNMIITNTIQLAAINVCQLFGGFIQRIQGDGLFVYFGGKQLNKNKVTEHCLTALSFFTYFVKNDLKRAFEKHGIERIYTRIGVDFGDDDKVLWGMAGIDNSSEIATYSLHTSLAAKMQGYAGSNEIVVGQHVKDKASFGNGLYSVVEDKRYIFSDPDNSFYYTQYKFDWLRYLQHSEYLATSTDGNTIIKPQTVTVPSPDSLRQLASANKPYAKK